MARSAATRKNIDTMNGNAGAKFHRRIMLARRAYQAPFTSERIRVGLDRAREEGSMLGRPPALDQE